MTAFRSRRPTPRRSLALRLGVAVALGAMAILVAAGIWNIMLQREHMTALIARSASGTADLIVRSTRESMLAHNPAALTRILDHLGDQPGVERIRIFDKTGRIRRSTDPDDIGHIVDMSAEQCFSCHRVGSPIERLSSHERTRTFETADGHRMLGIISPIRNEAACTQCHVHPTDTQVLGVFDVQLSLDPLEARLAASEGQLGLGLAVTVIAVVLLGGWLVKRRVLDPVARLTEASTRVAAGDFSATLPVTGDDEMSQLAEAWNAMVRDLHTTRSELEQLNRDCESLVDEKTEELEEAHRSMLMVEKMASLGKLSAVVAHELNNPLAGIVVYARLLSKRLGACGEGKDDTARILDMVGSEAVRCGNIVKNLLQFSRGSQMRFAAEDPADLLGRCVMLFRHQADLKGIEIVVDVADGTPSVQCDIAQIQQLLLALAINAIEAMDDDGRLSLRAHGEADDLVLEVSDTGRGIEPEHLDRVFEPFWSTKSGARASGLGLSVAYGIVQRHQGRIDVDSTPGDGTTFTVRLPFRGPQAPEEAADSLEEVSP